jgi:mRNA-degrading endonuclease RelE of RelBE toxin-antitoxin system
MKIVRHKDLRKDLKVLNKKFRGPDESLEAWILLFEAKGLSEITGVEKYPGFGKHDVYKARIVPLKENVGKSGGYRLLFEMREDQCILLFYSRHGVYKTEQELINSVKFRINTFQ